MEAFSKVWSVCAPAAVVVVAGFIVQMTYAVDWLFLGTLAVALSLVQVAVLKIGKIAALHNGLPFLALIGAFLVIAEEFSQSPKEQTVAYVLLGLFCVMELVAILVSKKTVCSPR